MLMWSSGWRTGVADWFELSSVPTASAELIVCSDTLFLGRNAGVRLPPTHTFTHTHKRTRKHTHHPQPNPPIPALVLVPVERPVSSSIPPSRHWQHRWRLRSARPCGRAGWRSWRTPAAATSRHSPLPSKPLPVSPVNSCGSPPSDAALWLTRTDPRLRGKGCPSPASASSFSLRTTRRPGKLQAGSRPPACDPAFSCPSTALSLHVLGFSLHFRCLHR